MSKKVYDVLEVLKSCTDQAIDNPNIRMGLDAAAISSKLQIHRSDASRLLNQLYKEKKAIKIIGRPIRYLYRPVLEEVLKLELGSDMYSMDELLRLLDGIGENEATVFDKYFNSRYFPDRIINSAKAAINYPPNGLPILITGPTGSGKTFLAEMMYHYAVDIGRFTKDIPFIRFNCSDYASNPQLLLSQLFGHEAGAYTDAKGEKKGLVEIASGGILFLDEVHSLHPRGQEMLFSIIDKGTYRRMGETAKERSTNIMLIMATSFNPKEALMQTLLRRIAIIIEMPPLAKRNPEERFNLIKGAFLQESNNLQKRIIVSKEVLNILMSYECPGNIGQLKTDIKNICSQAYLDKSKPILRVETSKLPEQIIMRAINIDKGSHSESICSTDLYIYPLSDDSKRQDRPIPLLHILSEECKGQTGSVTDNINYSMEIYLNQFSYFTQLYPIHNRVLYDKIGILLSDICGKKGSYEGLQLGFYYELEATTEGRQIQHKTLKSICNSAGLGSLLKKLDGKFRVLEADLKSANIPYNYAYTLFCWMHFIFNHKQTFDNRIYLMSDKSDVRQATADTVNKLLGFHNIEVLDKSKFTNPHLDQHDTGIVILDTDDAQNLLSDMISDKLDKAVHVVIHDISTTNVVVLSNKIIQYNWDYDRLINSIKKQQSAFSGKNQELSMSAIILLVCDENEPGSKKIKDVLLNIMNMTGNANITIYVLGLNQCHSYEELDRQVMELLNKHSVQFAVDLINYSYRHTGLNVIPFEAFIKRSNLMDLISGLNSRDISRNFLQDHIDDLAGLTDEEISINITRFISFIDINKVHEAFSRCVTWLYRSFSYQLDGIERVRLYLYISILLERVISGKYATASFSGALSENTRKIVENVSYTLEKYFNISIPASERIMLGKTVFERDDRSMSGEI